MKTEQWKVSGTRTAEDGTETKVETIVDGKVYENLAEAVADCSEARVLELFNVQNKTTFMNQARQSMVGRPSKGWLRDQAMSRITAEQWQAAAGDMAAINKVVDETMELIQKEIDAAKAKVGTVVANG